MWKGKESTALSENTTFQRNAREVQEQQEYAEYSSRFVREIKQLQITDHNDDPVTIAWKSQPWHRNYRQQISPCPYHVYILRRASAVLDDKDLPLKVVNWMSKLGLIAQENGCDPHFEIYSRGFSNSLSCMAHHRREVQHRNRNGLIPRLQPSWHEEDNDTFGFRGFILVIDDDDWRSTGPLYAEFDGDPFDRERHWINVHPGMECIARVVRVDPETLVNYVLRDRFRAAGGIWMQRELMNKNNGGFSPALYPAMDPVANEDAISASPITVPGSSLASSDQTEDLFDYHEPKLSPSLMHFNTRDLRESLDASPHINSLVYEDTLGWQTESVWDSHLSKVRPTFAFTLYLAPNVPPYNAVALFNCLNTHLLSAASWSLDVVRNLPDIASALQHYDHEARRRIPTSGNSLSPIKQCMRMISRKIAGQILPEELVDGIVDACCPPDYTDYSRPPARPFEHVFLFLDGTMLQLGPQIVYSRPVDAGIHPAAKTDISAEITDDSPTTPGQSQLYLSHLQFWRLVVDELHTIWSLCGPRCDVPSERMPRIAMKYTLSPESNATNKSYFSIFLKLECDRSVVVHSRGWDNFFDDLVKIDDITDSGKELPVPVLQIDSHLGPERMRTQTWATEPIWPWQHEYINSGWTIFPRGKNSQSSLGHAENMRYTSGRNTGLRRWWGQQQRAFQPGHTYRLRFKGGFTLNQWTFGENHAREGPYNLPPIEVVVSGEREFTFAFANDEVAKKEKKTRG